MLYEAAVYFVVFCVLYVAYWKTAIIQFPGRVLGTTLGVLVGVSASLFLDRYEIVTLPADVYLMTHVPFAVHPREVALVAAFALATAVAAAALPARAAARLAPGEAIRLSR